MTRPGPECGKAAQENQRRLASQGLPPCGRLMDPSCRFSEDIGHAADVIEEGRRVYGIKPVDELVVASLVARIHGTGTQVVTEGVEKELARRKRERLADKLTPASMDGLIMRDRWA